MTDYLYSAIAGLFLAGTILVLQPKTEPSSVVEETHTSPRERWAVALLAELGNAHPSTDTIAFVVSWTLAEDRSGSALARNNPLNTTICGHNWTGAINSDGACGVGGYRTYQDGISATVDTLLQQNFSTITAALQANDAEGAKAALWSSPWAASHYNGGVDWPEANPPPVSLPKCLPTSTGAISAHFADTVSSYWSEQAGGMHNGTDYSGQPGEAVYAPFAFQVEDIQYYGDPGRIGWYIQGRFEDGYLFYAGHLGSVGVQVGQSVPACTVIGTIGEVFHSHIKVASPDMPIPCEATGCIDFEEYFNAR